MRIDCKFTNEEKKEWRAEKDVYMKTKRDEEQEDEEKYYSVNYCLWIE